MKALSLEVEDGIGIVTFDAPGQSINTLSRTVAAELVEALDELARDSHASAVAFLSAKPDVFIAGADINEFVSLASEQAAAQLSRTGQALVARLADLPKPSVMGIDGRCLGGGLELALAAHYRVASSAPRTELGLPEVRLGLLPGASGCQRLPRLIGLRAAMAMILSGRPVDGARALRRGLVDELVPPALLRDVTLAAARRLAAGWRPIRRRPSRLERVMLDANPVGRRLVVALARRQLERRLGGHYPAPPMALDAMAHGLAHGFEAGLVRESQLFGRLAMGAVSRNLVHLFFASTAVKKDVGAGGTTAEASDVNRVGIVGAGFMGAAIAGLVALEAGADVRLRDTDAARVARGVRAARGVLDARRRRRRLDRFDHFRRRALISGGVGHAGFARRDLVIEAVFEDLEVKRRVLTELEGIVADRCVLATNTSTLRISDLQRGTRHPARIVGMHFFSPADRMPLVEVIRGAETAAGTLVTAAAFARRLGKTVIVVSDSPGFLVNRMLAPYLNEAGWLLAEGVAVESIDRAMTRLGFPVGPLALLDEVGLDVADKAATVLFEAFGPRLRPAPAVGALVSRGRLGRKSGRGFYQYKGGKRRGVDPSVYGVVGAPARRSVALAHVERRLLLALLNESVWTVADQVVASPREADLGAIYGFGFPPYLGGPLRQIDRIGAGAVADELSQLADRIGNRLAPAPLLVDMARSDRSFHA